MSQTSDSLMKQLHFIMRASNCFMHQNKQRLSGQQRVLAILNLEDGLTQNYLAKVLALRPGSLAELLKKMEVKGYIKRTTDPEDKRSKHVYLTDEGHKEADKQSSVKNEDYSAEFFAGLDKDEQEQLSKYLQKIADGWDPEFKKQTQKFVDPTDRLKAMSAMRSAMMKGNMTKEEIKEWRHRMSDFRRPGYGMHSRCSHVSEHDRPWENMRNYDRDFWNRFWDNHDEKSDE